MCAAGGGDVKIESHRVSFREKAQSKVGSMDNVSHSPGGGNVKVRPRLMKTCVKSVCAQPSYVLTVLTKLVHCGILNFNIKRL